ncbi:MAG: hypothetical protein J6A16_10350 [Oscillospiraceae bacterium]|nr:hypothetical protein [Oscillospiraceae bacterium]
MENFKKICPQCKTKYPQKAINCDNCNITLMKITTYVQKFDDDDEQLNEVREKINTQKEQVKKSRKYEHMIYAVVALLVLIGVIGVLYAIISLSNTSDKEYKCAHCDKTYTDIDNKSSIARTNFCEKCYDDYQFISAVQEELEKYE